MPFYAEEPLLKTPHPRILIFKINAHFNTSKVTQLWLMHLVLSLFQFPMTLGIPGEHDPMQAFSPGQGNSIK